MVNKVRDTLVNIKINRQLLELRVRAIQKTLNFFRPQSTFKKIKFNEFIRYKYLFLFEILKL
jgi:hypothetical protein